SEHVVGIGRALEPPEVPEHGVVGGRETVAREALDLSGLPGHELAGEPERLELTEHVEDRLVLAFAGHVLHRQMTLPATQTPFLRSDLVECSKASTTPLLAGHLTAFVRDSRTGPRRPTATGCGGRHHT